MQSYRHIFFFVSLGLFWGLGQSLYKTMSNLGIPPSHVIFMTGIGVGIGLMLFGRAQGESLWITRKVSTYGLICALLMNIPFAFGLYIIRFVPPTEMALVISTAPLFSYVLALVTRQEDAAPRRLAAVALGFVSSAMLILTREGTLSGRISWWTIAAFAIPTMYLAYNWYAAHAWPKGANVYAIGVAESFWSAAVAAPFFLLLDGPWQDSTPALFAYWTVAAATIMWVIERIAFFTLIRDKGALYTMQAVYLSTPAAVIFAMLFYGGAADAWLWLSLALLMLALWLNNSGSMRKAQLQPGQ